MQLAYEQDKVVKKVTVLVHEQDQPTNSPETNQAIAIDQFIGQTIAQMLVKLAENEQLSGGKLAEISITNPDYRDLSYDQNLADHDIWEAVDPIGYKEANEDTVIEPLDYICLVYVFYAEPTSTEDEVENEPTEDWSAGAPMSGFVSSYNPFTGRGETYQEWVERQNQPSPPAREW